MKMNPDLLKKAYLGLSSIFPKSRKTRETNPVMVNAIVKIIINDV